MFKLVGAEQFEIGPNRTRCEISIDTSSGLTYEYSLKVNGKQFQRFKEKQQRNLKSWSFERSGRSYRVVLGRLKNGRPLRGRTLHPDAIDLVELISAFAPARPGAAERLGERPAAGDGQRVHRERHRDPVRPGAWRRRVGRRAAGRGAALRHPDPEQRQQARGHRLHAAGRRRAGEGDGRPLTFVTVSRSDPQPPVRMKSFAVQSIAHRASQLNGGQAPDAEGSLRTTF